MTLAILKVLLAHPAEEVYRAAVERRVFISGKPGKKGWVSNRFSDGEALFQALVDENEEEVRATTIQLLESVDSILAVSLAIRLWALSFDRDSAAFGAYLNARLVVGNNVAALTLDEILWCARKELIPDGKRPHSSWSEVVMTAPALESRQAREELLELIEHPGGLHLALGINPAPVYQLRAALVEVLDGTATESTTQV